MSSDPKYLQLGGLYHLAIGQLYEEECLRDIKEELEAAHGVKLYRTATRSEVIFVCRYGLVGCQNRCGERDGFSQQNDNTDKNTEWKKDLAPLKCGYCVKFGIELRYGKLVYRLKHFQLTHSQTCLDPQQASFLKNRRILTIHTEALFKIVAIRRARNQECSNPRQIFSILCQEVCLPRDFLFAGVEQENFRRKLKKKLDNLIAEARRAQVNPLQYLSAIQYLEFKDKDKESNICSLANLEQAQQVTDFGPNQPKLHQRISPQSATHIQKGQKKVSKVSFNQLGIPRKRRNPDSQFQSPSIASCMTLNSEVDANQIDPRLLSQTNTFLQSNKCEDYHTAFAPIAKIQQNVAICIQEQEQEQADTNIDEVAKRKKILKNGGRIKLAILGDPHYQPTVLPKALRFT